MPSTQARRSNSRAERIKDIRDGELIGRADHLSQTRDRLSCNRGEDSLTKLTLIAPPIRGGSTTHTSRAAIMLGVALAAAPTAALADAQVRGNPEAVTIEARNTSVEEILKALSGTFDVHYRSSANLQMQVTGNYEGSLQRVMKRILDGYSYFVKSADGRIDITVLDAPRTAPSSGASAAFRVVGLPADTVPPQPPPAFAAVEQSATPAAPAAPSTAASRSFEIAGSQPPPRAEDKVPAQSSPPIAIVQPPPASPAAPSSRRRDHVVVAGGTESRPAPPRRIKIASSSSHWKKSKHHALRARLAHSSIVCGRRVRSFGSPVIPVSSSYWFAREPLYLRSVTTCVPRRHARIQQD
jgi:hypothetical protein